MPAVTTSQEGAVKMRAKPIGDKALTAQGDSEVASNMCEKRTVLLSLSQIVLLFFLVAYVIVSVNKLSALEDEISHLQTALEEQLIKLQISSKSGICHYQIKIMVVSLSVLGYFLSAGTMLTVSSDKHGNY